MQQTANGQNIGETDSMRLTLAHTTVAALSPSWTASQADRGPISAGSRTMGARSALTM